MPKSRYYLQLLKKRKGESHAHTAFQLAGLEIADLLGDRAHKSLYIKLAKEYGSQPIRQLAAEVKDHKDVRNKGAYFMTLLKDLSPRKK